MVVLPMWEGSGNMVYDYSGNGRSGTLTGGSLASRWSAFDGGRCLDFARADNEYVSLPAAASLNGLSAFTIALTTRYDGSTSDSDEHTLFGDWASPNRNVLLRFDSQTDKVEFFAYTSDSEGGGFDGTNLEDRKLHRIVATYDGAALAVSMDGQPSSTSPIAQTGVIGEGSAAVVYVGNSSQKPTVDEYNGPICNVLVADRAWTPGEIAADAADPWAIYRPAGRTALWAAAAGAVPSAQTPWHLLIQGAA